MMYVFLPNGSTSQLVPADRVVFTNTDGGTFQARILGEGGAYGGANIFTLNGIPQLMSLEDGLTKLASLMKPASTQASR